MGLGPPVCDKCWVIGKWRNNLNPCYCPVCNSTELNATAWSCGMTQEELDGNLRFLLFMKGEELK